MNPTAGLRLLIVDDNADHRALVLRELSREFANVRATEANDAAGLQRALAEGPYDVVVTDYQMHSFDGLSVLREVKAALPDCPVVMFTGTGSEEIAVAAMKAGLEDYVLKSPKHFPLLVSTVRSVLERVEQRRRQRQTEEELRRSREQLLHAQRMESLGRLAGGIAHDFNNLLTGISAYVSLASLELHEKDPLQAEMRGIQEIVGRASNLTRQLLAFGRKQALAPRVLDLNELVLRIESLLRRLVGEDVELRTELDPQVGGVLADAGQIEQALINLVLNARDAMPRGGTIRIQTSDLGSGLAWPEPVPDGAFEGPAVLLAVHDTGHGMDEATRGRVFEPFFTTKEPGRGTGLGLASVYGIVRQSHGVAEVRSTPGEGASFRLYFPRQAMAPEPAEPEMDRRSWPRGTEGVLLVEDDEVVRRLCGKILRSAGYTVVEAGTVAEALEAARRPEPPLHLLVTDLVLPDGTGPDLAAHLHGLRPSLPVLHTSGYMDESLQARGVEPLKLLPPLSKPFGAEELLRAVRQRLDGTG